MTPGRVCWLMAGVLLIPTLGLLLTGRPGWAFFGFAAGVLALAGFLIPDVEDCPA